ncbi:MAG: transcription antitermination factor NusB, partial [Mycobacteriales bacterium]
MSDRGRKPGGGKRDHSGKHSGHVARGGSGNDRRFDGQRRGGRSDSGPGRGRFAVDPVRRAVFDVLVAVSSRDAYANLLLPGLLRDRRISGRDAAFATELTYGTLRARRLLDAVIVSASSRPLPEIDPRVLEVLRLGAYQLLYTRVPHHAAVDATVGVAKVALTDGPSRFVNAVLRRVAEHDRDAWLEVVLPDREADPAVYLAIKYSHPEWIVRALSDALGEESGELSETERALVANNERPSVQLVARPGRIDR